MTVRIKFICHYDIQENKHLNRNYALSAVNKIDYLIKLLNSIEYNVDIISLSSSKLPKYQPGEQITRGKNQIKWFYSIAWKTKVHKAISYIYMNIALFLYLLFNTKKGETIIVYHSMQYLKVLSFVKKVKRLKFILELEEIYSDVDNKISRSNELKFINKATSYIVSNDNFLSYDFTIGKSAIVYYGTYSQYSITNKNLTNSKLDTQTKIVYGGTFDQKKAGVTMAINIAKYLNKNFKIYVLGFGSYEEEQGIKRLILESNKKNECQIDYKGSMTGDSYLEFLSECDIGLSTQNPHLEYNKTSFPSKILTYLSCGLNIVSSNINVLKVSKISHLVSFVEEYTPKEFSKVIKECRTKEQINSSSELIKLESKLKTELIKLLERR